ncbi:MAG: response regulator transcription factor [Isosphaeraceae bacterium]
MRARDGGKILLVEDEEILRELVSQFLRGEGHDVVEAAEGPQAVDRYTRLGPFQVVLLDLNLPFLSGVEVCRRIRELDPLQNVMICSAAILDDHLAELEALGVDQFLTKPYHPAELLARVQALLRGDVGTRSPAIREGGPGPEWRRHPAHPRAAASHALFNRTPID